MAVKGAKGRTGRVVVWVIVALLIVGLAGFGATSFGGGVGRLGQVGEVEITADEYARALRADLRQISEETGQPFTMEAARAFGIDRRVLARLVGRAALDDEARRIGLSVGDAHVAREIRAIPAFQGLNGDFDREAYEFVLEREGLDAAQFEEQVRSDAARGLLQAAVAGGVRIPDVFADTLYAHEHEQRGVTWAVLSPDKLEAEVPEPTEAELEAFHAENAQAFTAPEERALTYAWITPDMLAGEMETDEAMLRDLYEERQVEYRQPERRLVERLVFGSEAEAQAAADAIAADETTFDALVAERNLTLADVDLGDVRRDDLGAAADPVFALDEPGVAGPAATDLGPALFRVNAILGATEIPFEEAREDLAAEVEADRARRTIEDMESGIEDLLAGGATLEELAEESEMELGTLTLGPETTEAPAAYEAFRAEAMSVEAGDYPELARLDDGGLFALRVDEVRPPALRPLDEVRDEVEETWRAARTREALLDQAEELADAIGGGAGFAAQGLGPGTATGVTRDGVVEGLSPEAVASIFELTPGEAMATSVPGGAAVIRLDTITPADQSSPEAQAEKSASAEQSAVLMADDLLAAFVAATEQAAGISLDQAAIQSVNAQLP
jgi:peptidyl-prolyl cis-trans isomerase D